VTGSLAVLRGLWWRRGLSGMILIVAVIAAAAATTGPVYYAAAKQSIVQDDFHAAKTLQQGIDVEEQGPVPDLLQPLSGQVARTLRGKSKADLFGTPIHGLEIGTVKVGDHTQATTLAWRHGACARLTFLAGHCPSGPKQAVVSGILAHQDHLKVGHKLPYLGLTLVGIYRPHHPHARYWFARGYFPQQGTQASNPFAGGGLTPVDATFVTRGYFAKLKTSAQGSAVVDVPLTLDAVRAGDIAPLNRTVHSVTNTLRLSGQGVPTTGIQTVIGNIRGSWRALLVPVFLITAQLLVLAWLLLFLVVTDAAEARGPEVALAKLRGLSRAKSVRFGLAEPVILMLAALPLGALAGWGATIGLSSVLLRSGTPVSLVTLGWAAAAVAVAGGLVAAGMAARRTLTRPVVSQWARASRSVARRAWILDAALLVAAAAALVDLFSRGNIGSTQGNVLALLVPGLLAIAIAVLASRVLPAASRTVYGFTRKHGGIGAFLAVRQIARRPNGARTTIVLATAFGLAAFAIAAWSASRANLSDVAHTQVGAAAVLDVTPPQGQSLPKLVHRLDPSGHQAMAVESYTDFSNKARILYGVNPQRYAHVAYWRHDFAQQPLHRLTHRLHPPIAQPIQLHGSKLRVDVTVAGLHTTPELPKASGHVQLAGELKSPTAFAPVPVTFGPRLHNGHNTVTTDLASCPCTLRELSLAGIGGGAPAARGTLTITKISERVHGKWTPVDAGLSTKRQWRVPNEAGSGGTLQATQAGLRYKFNVPASVSPQIVSEPPPLPALVTGGVAKNGIGKRTDTTGLDGSTLAIEPIARVPVPGAPQNAVVVDRAYAQQAASGQPYGVQHQVWLAPSAVKTFPAKLRHAGVGVTSTQTAAGLRDQFSRQGPALALVLFLADAAAAAILAAAGAVLALYLAGRRRTYELAALAATGARRRTLRGGLLLEQGLTLGFGTLVGIGAGILAAFLAVPSVPEFVHKPSAPALLYSPNAAALAALLAVAVVLLAIASVASVTSLVRSARPDQLREAPA
jgi:hypothetical protein